MMDENMIGIHAYEDEDGDLNIEIVTRKARFGLSFGSDNYCYYVEKDSDNSLSADIPDDLVKQIVSKLTI